MIKNQDRSGYFGASDTRYVVAKNRSTRSWIGDFWEVKLGAPKRSLNTREIRAGNKFEHPILMSIDDKIITDGQIIIDKYLLRVNYDGYKDGVIYEVKTHDINKPFEVTQAYWQQCQVEMFCYMEMSDKWFLPPFKKLEIVSYGLYESDYGDGEAIVDPNRVNREEIKYDNSWIKGTYLPNLKELSRKLKKQLKKQGE